MAAEQRNESHAVPHEPEPAELNDPRPHSGMDSPIRPRPLWFGFVTSAASWVTLGCLDLLITWRACTHQEDYGLPSHPTSATLLYLIATVILLALTISAGVTSYRNWRHVSSQPRILEAPSVERSEFMAVLGVIISITMGVGIVLLALPPFFLSLCWRAR